MWRTLTGNRVFLPPKVGFYPIALQAKKIFACVGRSFPCSPPGPWMSVRMEGKHPRIQGSIISYFTGLLSVKSFAKKWK
jgi:hypothetical protein